MDADVYVSYGDGRKPTVLDYDFKSDMMGPDHLNITYTNDFFVEKGYRKLEGVFIVAVIAKQDNTNYVITPVLEKPLDVSVYELKSDQPLSFERLSKG